MAIRWLTRLWKHGVGPVMGGGTEAYTASEEIRWNYRRHYREDWRAKHDAFRKGLIDTAHMKLFEQFAQIMCELPESSSEYTSICSISPSRSASRFLKKLDNLHTRQPKHAWQIAAIAAGSSLKQYAFTQEVTRRICDWLMRNDMPLRDRLTLGTQVIAAWPEATPPDALEHALLNVFTEGSIESPDLVWQIFRTTWESRGTNSSYVVALVDDPAKLLVIARNLKSLGPEFCKNIFNSCLTDGRNRLRSYAPSEQMLQEIASEYFELLSADSPSKALANGWHYFNLCQWACRDSAWYPEVLERLQSAAKACPYPAQAAEWHRALAMNAPRASKLFNESMSAFGTYATSFTKLPTDASYEISKFADFLGKTLVIATSAKPIRGRNFALPPDPMHPIVGLVKDAFWGLVSWSSTLPSAAVVACLGGGYRTL